MSFVDDDRAPGKPAPHVVGSDLSTLSVDELKSRIALLQAEIARLEADIARKTNERSAAESLFRKG